MKPTLALITLAALLSSCSERESTANANPPENSPELTAVFESEPAAEPQAIHVARQSAESGDELTVSGRIMGNANPFVDGRAAFILGDPEIITSCDELPDDACETPWDACCDTPENKKRGTATIQVTDAEGRVLGQGLEGVGGLEKLATVTVTGTAAEGTSSDLLVINASAIRAGE